DWKQDCSTLAQHGFWCLLPGLISCTSKNLAKPLQTLQTKTSKTVFGRALKKTFKVAKKTYKTAKRFLIKET
ncbi:hypothetical protein KAU11_01110, partial [Candidatus Babeliales bacterium]|nr:hypothetical protein [Candidatus Babeliales bacterium]